ncbi:MAG: exonuclease SbcCD subunit D [Synergistaceae bacterium]|jgi:exonuclease SbcD|nr:exonuclease SbcCD subunit D [Synergistaceae bacterium]
MKFLHLSDLHIGKSVNGFSMLEEQVNAFRQVYDYIDAERPDAVLIAGDVYDRSVPGVEAVRVFDDFLTELVNKDVVILIVSGNHDSPERMNYASRLLTEKKLYICGAFDGQPQKVTLTDEYGEVDFWLLPFIKPLSVRGMFGEREAESYTDAVSAALGGAGIDYNRRNVLVSHQFYTKTGIEPIRSESESNPVGGLDAVDAGVIERFDYAALGHLHGSQTLGSEHIRYAGSPVKYSFSECRQKKSVTLIELKAKGGVSVTDLPLAPIHDMREIKGELLALTSKEIVESADKDDYLRVILTDEGEIIDAFGKIRSVYPNVMALQIENSHTSIDRSEIIADSEGISALSPYELFSEFFLRVNGSTLSESQIEIVRTLLETENSL